MNQCPVHGIDWKEIPAGISKRTGQAYPAFKACPVKDCKEKPPQVPLTPDDAIDQSIIETNRNEVYSREDNRSYRIERMHGQEMAIRFMELKYKYDPPATDSKLDLAEKVRFMTNWFQKDLDK